MTKKEAKEMFDRKRNQGMTDEEILYGLYSAFCDGIFDDDELYAYSNVLGYDITDEFINASEEEKKNINLWFK